MPCSRVTTCGIGPNPALSPARSRRPGPVPAGCCLPLGDEPPAYRHEVIIPVSYVVLARRDVRVVQICSPTAPRVWHSHDLAAVNPRRIRTPLAMGLPRPAAG
jgi:hypothetical protein